MIAMYITYAVIALSLPFFLYRLIKGPEWSDRIMACDLFAIYMIAGLLALKYQNQWAWDRDVIWLVLSLSLITVLGAGIILEESHRG